MTIFYDMDLDYAEVFFKKEANYGENLNDTVMTFKSEENHKVVGYGFENASRTLFENDLISPSVKLAALLRIIRAKENLTQEQAAEKVDDITFRHYQRIESGEENPTLETIESIMVAFPKEDFSLILKHSPKAS